MNPIRKTKLASLGLALLGFGAWADEDAENLSELKSLSLEDLSSLRVDHVVGASRHDQKVTEAPSAVSIVTADDIKKQGYRTLADVLRGVRGFYVNYDRAYHAIGTRGINIPGNFGGRLLITIDGHRLNDPIYDTAASGRDFLLDVDLIERVEIIRGPGSSLYGNNAFLGVINVITRKGRDVNGAEFAGSVGTFDAYSGRVTYGNSFSNGVELAVSGSLYDSQGDPQLYYPEFSTINDGVAEDMDGARSGSGFASISWKGFSLQGGYVHSRKTWPTAPYSSDLVRIIFNDPRFFSTDERAFGEFKFQRALENQWEVMIRAYYDHFQTQVEAPVDYFDPFQPIYLNQNSLQSASVGGELQVSRTFWEKHRLTIGGDVRSDFRLSQTSRNLDPPASLLDSQHTAEVMAAYIQDEYQVFESLIINAGVRYDRFSTFGDTVNPRTALIYSPWKPTSFKFLYGQAFRAPNVYEFYGSVIGKPNPELGPETIDSYELVWEQRLGQHWSASASLFLNDIKGLIAYQQDPVDSRFYFDNVDSVQAKGIETEIEGHWAGGLSGRASYTYTHARDAKSGLRVSNSPEHLAKLGLSVPLWQNRLFASAEVQGMSVRETVRGGSVSGFWLANATLFSRELVKGLEISASVYNFLDQRYRDPVTSDFTQDSIPQDGRTFRVKLAWHF